VSLICEALWLAAGALKKKPNGRMFGKRGENPPLPRNCERQELGKQMTCSHWGLSSLGRLPGFVEA
jgi:hypothetical protein